MDSVISKVQSIELKVKKLTLLLEQYETDCALLKDENLRLKRNLAKYEDLPSEPKTIESEISIPAPVINPIPASSNNEALKSKVDRYIKEVDKCIELVNNW